MGNRLLPSGGGAAYLLSPFALRGVPLKALWTFWEAEDVAGLSKANGGASRIISVLPSPILNTLSAGTRRGDVPWGEKAFV